MLGHGGSSAGSYLADPTSPSPRTVLSLSCFKVSQCINCHDGHFKSKQLLVSNFTILLQPIHLRIRPVRKPPNQPSHSYIHLPTNQPIHSYVHPLTHLLIHTSTHLSIHPSIHPRTHAHPPTHPPTHSLICPYTPTHPLTHPPTNLTTHKSI